MRTQKYQIGQLGKVITGATPPTKHPELYGDAYPFITPTDITDETVTVQPERGLSELGYEKYRTKVVPAGAVCYTCIASIGKICIADRPSLTNQQINSIVVDEALCDYRFLYYLLRHKTPSIQAIASGAATPIINKSAFAAIEVDLPPLSAQKCIASFLWQYDQLIANNTRRIAILEEMAQAIYREWFVHFRFPGHEQVEMVESELGPIPAGWEVARLRDVIAVIESGSRPRSAKTDDPKGVVSIGAGNISGLGRYNYGKDPLVTRDFYDRLTKGRVKSGDVLLYKDGAQIGRKAMFRDGFPYEECCVNEHVLILRTNDRCSQEYLYFWLDQPDMTVRIINLNSNAAQPGITQDGVLGLPIVIPPREMINGFAAIADPLLRLLFNLAKRNRRLHQARDLLLPKLMSGEIDVEALESEPVGAVA